MKRLLSIVIILAMLIGSMPTVLADDTSSENDAYELAMATQFLSQFSEARSIDTKYILKNISGDVEACCYSLNPTGYIIVNINDLSIPEYSLYASCPFASTAAEYYYNGPVSYFEAGPDNKLIELNSNSLIDSSQITELYSQPSVDKELKLESIQTTSNMARATTEVYTQHMPDTWGSTSYYCGVDGSAIILKYLDRYHNSSLLNSAIDQYSTLTAHLVNNNYLFNSGLPGYCIADGGTYGSNICYGLDDFFVDRGMSSVFDVNDYSYSVTRLTNSFSNNFPALLGTGSESYAPGYQNHWLIAYGYTHSEAYGGYFIVNDGWGENGILVQANSSYYPAGIVVFS